MLYIFRNYLLCRLLTEFTDKALQCLETVMNGAVVFLTFSSSARKTPFYNHCIGFLCRAIQLVKHTFILCSVSILLGKGCF